MIVCVPARSEAVRLQTALPRTTVVRWARTNTELAAMFRAAGERLRMVVVAPRDIGDAPTSPLVRALREHRPYVAWVGYCRAANTESRDIIALASAGIHEIVFLDVSDWGNALQQTLLHAAQTCGATQAFERVSAFVPRALHPLIEYCLHFPQLATSVPRVASALGVHRKTLVNYTVRFGLPSPSVLITWCRLIIAAHLLESRGGSVERIALALEYPSATALRNTLRRYARQRPAELRQGGLDQMVTRFVEILANRGGPEARRAS